MSGKKKIEVLWNQTKSEEPKEEEKIRVAAYCRLSILSDEGKPNSLENQLKHYTRYIKSQENFKFVGI